MSGRCRADISIGSLIYIVYFLVIILIIYQFVSWRRESNGPEELDGRVVKGAGLASELGYPTINIIILGNGVPGVYNGMTEHGRVIVFVKTRNTAEVHYLVYNDEIDKRIKSSGVLHIIGLQRIEREDDSIIRIYNRGCRGLCIF